MLDDVWRLDKTFILYIQIDSLLYVYMYTSILYG